MFQPYFKAPKTKESTKKALDRNNRLSIMATMAPMVYLVNTKLVGGLEHFFPYIQNNHPTWLILIIFRGVETTNQKNKREENNTIADTVRKSSAEQCLPPVFFCKNCWIYVCRSSFNQQTYFFQEYMILMYVAFTRCKSFYSHISSIDPNVGRVEHKFAYLWSPIWHLRSSVRPCYWLQGTYIVIQNSQKPNQFPSGNLT